MVTIIVGWIFLHAVTWIDALAHLGIRIDENEVIMGVSTVVIALVMEGLSVG